MAVNLTTMRGSARKEEATSKSESEEPGRKPLSSSGHKGTEDTSGSSGDEAAHTI
jgi:hypothetical protein